MQVEVGNDIVEVARIKASIERYQEKFLNRIFTAEEQEYCLSRKEPSLHFAGRFAAKEAIVKALGTGFSQGINWLDVEIRNDQNGKPYAAISSKLQDLFESPQISISISHCHQYATACAVWLRNS